MVGDLVMAESILDLRVRLWRDLVLYALDRDDLDLWLEHGDPDGCLDVENWLEGAHGVPEGLAGAGALSEDAVRRVAALNPLVIDWHTAKHEDERGAADLDLWDQIRDTARPVAVELLRGMPLAVRRAVRPTQVTWHKDDGERIAGRMPDGWQPWLDWLPPEGRPGRLRRFVSTRRTRNLGGRRHLAGGGPGG